MSQAGRDDLTEFVDDSPMPRNPINPEQYVLAGRWYFPTVVGGTVALFGGLYSLGGSFPGLLALVIVGILAGLIMTMIAMAWAVAIVFADDTRRGLWFVLFPPYAPVYAALRWKWMAQPTVLFLCGMGLVIATVWATQHLTAKLVAPQSYEARMSATTPRFLPEP
jgi:hypothetical protein